MRRETRMAAFLCLALVAATFAMAGVVSADIPDSQCYQMASNKDNALANMDGQLQWSGSSINPCTGVTDTANVYYDLKGGVTQIRRVYGNGDAEGYLGLARYWVCQDGRAKVVQRIYGPIPTLGWAWGFYWNFPFDDDPSTWVKDKEICNTM
jgi:hypothetical protein